jgi:uncharacterized Rmd1/YagE family protein
MDCSAFCTASSYQIKDFFESIKAKYKASLIRDVIHVEFSDIVDVFYFPFGATICWGASLEESQQYLELIKEYEQKPLTKLEADDFSFDYGEEYEFVEDDIVLPDYEALTKLAISHGLAQSVKLGAFEDTIAHSFAQTRHIPVNLAAKGKIPLSRKEIRKKMGALFLDRSSINLHSDVLDTPEFFWEHPELETTYHDVANKLDIETRGQVLNQRLDVLRELFEMLGNELNHQHSSRLEWIIIWLILIEVVVTLLTYYHIV